LVPKAAPPGASPDKSAQTLVSVVINTIEHGPVEATIQNGYFAAWWPGPATSLGIGKGPTPVGPTYTLTLKDGTIRANIPQEQLQPQRK